MKKIISSVSMVALFAMALTFTACAKKAEPEAAPAAAAPEAAPAAAPEAAPAAPAGEAAH